MAEPITAADLRKWRARMGWKQKEAAAWLIVPHRTYQNWEEGHRKLRHGYGVRVRMQLAEKRYGK